MPRIINNISVEEEKDGLIVDGSFADATVPTDASIFAKGCILRNVANGKVYTNAGSVASPSFQDINDVATAEIADLAVTTGKLAAQAVSMAKLARGTNGQIIVANTSADPAYVTLSGDATLSAAGALTIGAGAVDSGNLETNLVLTDKVVSIQSLTPVNAVASAGTITVSGTPVVDETMVIDTQTFTFAQQLIRYLVQTGKGLLYLHTN